MHLEYWVQIWDPRCKRDRGTLQWVQSNATKVIKALEHLTCEERLRVGSVQPRGEKALGDLINVYKYPTGRTKEMDTDFS